MSATTFVRPEDRMPTIDEFRSFDPAAAWDRLSPEQQRAVGVLAVELSVAENLLNYENTYTPDQRKEITNRGCDALTLFVDGTEPLWPLMFGWVTPAHHRFRTLEEAENALLAQGFRLVPNTCNWIDPTGTVDAGCYEAEKLSNDPWSDACFIRIEYRNLTKPADVSARTMETVDA